VRILIRELDATKRFVKKLMKMKKNNSMLYRLIISMLFVAFLYLGLRPTDVRGAVEVSFLYSLSNFSGPIPYNRANIHVDEARNEIYVVDTRERDIRIFDKNGMEVYRFDDDQTLGMPVDLVVERDGNILVLSKGTSGVSIILSNFRGEPMSELKLRNFPPEFSQITPNRMALKGGRLYLVDSYALMIAVTDLSGGFKEGYDLVPLLGIEEKKRTDIEMGGFSVDGQGNMLFTLPVLFTAYRLAPDGKITSFGTPGSAPGRFGIVGGIVSDEKGNFYVADRLKSVVMIFDKDFKFLKEFGFRGLRRDNLIGPRNLVLDPQGRIYVSQLRNRGVSAFEIKYK